MDSKQSCPLLQREPHSLSFQIAGSTAYSLEESPEEKLSVQKMCRNMRLMDNCLPIVVFSYWVYWIVRILFILSVQTFGRYTCAHVLSWSVACRFVLLFCLWLAFLLTYLVIIRWHLWMINQCGSSWKVGGTRWAAWSQFHRGHQWALSMALVKAFYM